MTHRFIRHSGLCQSSEFVIHQGQELLLELAFFWLIFITDWLDILVSIDLDNQIYTFGSV